MFQQLDFALHRLDSTRDSLGRLVSRTRFEPSLARAIADLSADVAFEDGDYDAAANHYRSVDLERAGPIELFRLARLAWATGDFAAADGLMLAAGGRYHGDDPTFRPWLELQRGQIDLDQGRYEDALDHFRGANRDFGGWWLVQEHIGEALSLLGREREAAAVYERVVLDTGAPEFLSALADLVEEGQPNRAAQLRADAAALYEQRLAEFPEAGVGHALDFYLGDPAQVAQAVELAEANFEARRGAPARIALAQAYLLADRVDDADRALEPALNGPWQSAELFATAARLAEARGDLEGADRFVDRARAIRPDALAHLPGHLAD